jgi:hypothetical protein
MHFNQPMSADFVSRSKQLPFWDAGFLNTYIGTASLLTIEIKLDTNFSLYSLFFQRWRWSHTLS